MKTFQMPVIGWAISLWKTRVGPNRERVANVFVIPIIPSINGDPLPYEDLEYESDERLVTVVPATPGTMAIYREPEAPGEEVSLIGIQVPGAPDILALAAEAKEQEEKERLERERKAAGG